MPPQPGPDPPAGSAQPLAIRQMERMRDGDPAWDTLMTHSGCQA